MTDQNEHDDAGDSLASGTASDEAQTRRPGERLAKAIARAGLGSRRDAEVWIGEGRVKVNGKVVDAAAFNVMPKDRIEVDGRALPERERTRMWLYHKPRGYVTTNRDPEGRETVFEILPPGLPRVMTIGRLDINTEGLLLLTNDGGLARVLELPETGWLRRYRVRAFGRVTQEKLAELKDGLTIDGFSYGPIEAEVERQQADNVWLMIGLREGKNREVKRVAEHLGLAVNRLIRISFGPFQLGQLGEGEAEEVRSRTLTDQLGKRLAEEAGCDFESDVVRDEDAPRVTGGRGGKTVPRPAPRDDRERLTDASQRVGRRAPLVRPRDVAAPTAAEPADRKAPETRTKRGAPVADRQGRKVAVERVSRAAGDEAPKRVTKRDPAAAERFGAAGRAERPGRPGAKSPANKSPAREPRGDRPERGPRREGEDRPFRAPSGDRPRTGRVQRSDTAGERPARGPRPDRAERPSRDGDRPSRPSFGDRPRPARGDRPDRGERPKRTPSSERSEAPRTPSSRPAPRWRDDGPAGGARPYRPAGDRPQRDRPAGDRPQRDRSERPIGGRPEGGRPPRRDGGERPGGAGGRPPRGDRPSGDRPAGAGRTGGDRPAGAGRTGGDRPAGAGRPGGDRPAKAGRPGGKPGGFKPSGFKPGGPKGGGRPGGAGGGRPGGGGRPSGGKPGGKPSGGGRGKPGGADRRR